MARCPDASGDRGSSTAKEARTPMRSTRALWVALAATFLLATPAGAVTHGVADNSEHPYVGELLFYVPDAIDSRFDDPGSWFSCSGTLLNGTVVVTPGHRTFRVRLDGESTTHGGADTT